MRKRLNLLLSLCLYLVLIGLVVYLCIYYLRYSWVLLLLATVATILTAIIIFLTNRLVDVKLSWIMVVICLPILGIFLYWVFGKPYRYRRKQKVHLNLFRYFYKQEDWNFTKEVLQDENSKYSLEAVNAFRYTTRISFRPIYKNTHVSILTNGPENYMHIIEDIKNAQHYIFMNYYIIGEGELFDTIFNMLAQKVQAGVRVYIIYDHVGSYFVLTHDTIKRIKKMGIHMHRFAPIKLPFLTGSYNFRNHRKDVIIDGVIGYTGGINLSDTYVHMSAKGFWRDTQVRLEGEAVTSLELIFRQDWHFITGEILEANKPKQTAVVSNVQTQKDVIVQIIDDGPLTKETIQKDMFVKYISMAKKRVWITTPFLFPTADLITALKNSAYSGVDVRLCLPGILEHYLLQDLGRTYYDELLEAGVKIYEYVHVINHSKMGIFDDQFSVIGSTNLDYRSLYSDHQTLVSIYDRHTNEVLATRFFEDFKYSNLIKSNPLLKRNKFYHYVFLFLMRIVTPLF